MQIEERVVFFLPGREEERPGKNSIAFGDRVASLPAGLSPFDRVLPFSDTVVFPSDVFY